MIENNLDEISQRVRAVTPVDWQIDTEMDDLTMLIRHKNERKITNSDIDFISNAGTDIASLVIEVKQLRDINRALKRQVIVQEVEKDLRFM